DIPPVTDAATLRGMQAALEDVAVEDSIQRYLVAITAATRTHNAVLVGASPRGSLALMLMARAVAALAGRDYVVPEDVKKVGVPALAHRLTLKPEVWLRRVDPGAIVSELLDSTPAPVTGAMPRHSAGPGPRAETAPVDGVDPYRYTAPPRS
ncbi:MAG TPA: MoxR family ATPase, partial [Micromonosporaceae bacterium]|nr:MoxR family ATPase [Micromonosporaceae bacterium]